MRSASRISAGREVVPRVAERECKDPAGLSAVHRCGAHLPALAPVARAEDSSLLCATGAEEGIAPPAVTRHWPLAAKANSPDQVSPASTVRRTVPGPLAHATDALTAEPDFAEPNGPWPRVASGPLGDLVADAPVR
jgi:hypothetical protein